MSYDSRKINVIILSCTTIVAILFAAYLTLNLYGTPTEPIEGRIVGILSYTAPFRGPRCVLKISTEFGKTENKIYDFCNSYFENGDRVKLLIRRGRIDGSISVISGSVQRDMFYK